MSGIEVAGLVLGALPLIISALEHYANGARMIATWWKYQRELKDLRRALNVDFEIYRNICGMLLSRIESPRRMAALLEDPGGPAWKNPDLEKAMAELLRQSYTGYIDTIENMNEAVIEFKEKLCLGPDGKWDEKSSLKKTLKIIKFSLEKSAYEGLIQRIKSNNNSLKLLTDTTLALETSRNKWNVKVPNFKRVRECARSVHSIITSSLRCPCSPLHKIGLRLDARTKNAACLDSDDDDDTLLSQLKFRILLTYAKEHTDLISAPWIYEEAEIRGVARQHPNHSNAAGATTVATFKKAVTFSQSLSTNSGGTMVQQQTTTLQTIDDLCATIANPQSMRSAVCLGILMDNMTQRKHALYPIPTPVVEKRDWSTVTLENILEGKCKAPRRLKGRDTRRLALTLASSVLQLYKTPWLETELKESEIAFLKRPGDSFYEDAFLSKTVSASIASRSPAIPMVRNPTLFNLGMLLIELCLGRKVEGNGSQQIDELISEVSEDYGIEFGNAVRRCIWCDFNYQSADLAQEGFCAVVYTGVVSVFEEELKLFTRGFT